VTCPRRKQLESTLGVTKLTDEQRANEDIERAPHHLPGPRLPSTNVTRGEPPGADDDLPALFRVPQQFLNLLDGRREVRIHEQVPRPPRGEHPFPYGRTLSAVFAQGNEAQPFVFRGKFLNDRGGFIGGTVVDDNDLVLRVVLGEVIK